MAGVAFRGTVHHRGRSVNLVWLPADVVDALWAVDCPRIPVRGSVGGATYVGWLRRSRHGDWYVLVDRHLRDGDVVDVELDHDPSPDRPDLPDDMADLLAGFPRAQAGWEDLPPSRRREYLDWVGEVGSGPARTRRIMAAIEKLREDEP